MLQEWQEHQRNNTQALPGSTEVTGVNFITEKQQKRSKRHRESIPGDGVCGG